MSRASRKTATPKREHAPPLPCKPTTHTTDSDRYHHIDGLLEIVNVGNTLLVK